MSVARKAVMGAALTLWLAVVAGVHCQAAPAAPQAGSAEPAETFGVEVTLTAKTVVYTKGVATWDNAYETLVDTFKTVYGYLEKQGITPAGPAMTIYLATDDTGFQFQAAIPIAEEPKNPPQGDIAIGKSPEGKALKFVHRGSYDEMDSTYDAITNYLDEKRLDAKDLFIEQYPVDLRTVKEDKLVIEIFVPIK